MVAGVETEILEPRWARGSTVLLALGPYPDSMRRVIAAVLLVVVSCAGCKMSGATQQEDKTQQRFNCAAANLAGANGGASTTIQC